jgi:hypothetical protein
MENNALTHFASGPTFIRSKNNSTSKPVKFTQHTFISYKGKNRQLFKTILQILCVQRVKLYTIAALNEFDLTYIAVLFVAESNDGVYQTSPIVSLYTGVQPSCC